MKRAYDETDVAFIKGMLIRGDKQSDMAAYFGINHGRISEMNTGQKWSDVAPKDQRHLPPPGPYMPVPVRRALARLKKRVKAESATLDRATLNRIVEIIDEDLAALDQRKPRR